MPKATPKSPLASLASRTSRLTSGHRLCPGCGIGLIVKQVLAATTDPVIVVNATGCSEICTSPFPETAWQTPWIHSLFANSAAVGSGVAAALTALKRTRRLPKAAEKAKVLIIAGDGATYDIGLQALSGAVERGHDFVYLCLDNEGYMNTGYQKSSATPLGASTSTTPSGKPTPRKDLMQILVAHGIPYAAQGSPHAWADLTAKATEAFATPGPAFLNVLAPCPTNWKSAPAAGLALLAAAADTCAWPLYEVVNGKYTVNNRPQVKKPLAAYLAGQKRFASLLKPENAQLLAAAEAEVEASWQNLLAKATKA